MTRRLLEQFLRGAGHGRLHGEQRRHQVTDRGVQLRPGHHQLGQAQRGRLRGPHGAAGQAQLEGPGQSDDVDQRLGPGQVGHQAQRRFLHAQLGVLGEHPQITGQRELEPGPDRVPAHGGHRHDARVAQPGEASLDRGDPLLEAGIGGTGHALTGDTVRREQAQVDPRRERGTRALHHHHPHLRRQGLPDRRQPVPHARRHRVAPLAPVERDRGRPGAGTPTSKRSPACSRPASPAVMSSSALRPRLAARRATAAAQRDPVLGEDAVHEPV